MTERRTVTIREEFPYGKRQLYPTNELAEMLVELMGRKTFLETDFPLLKKLGYEIEVSRAVRSKKNEETIQD